MSALLEGGEQKGEKNEKNYKKPIMLPRTPYIYFLKQRRSQYPGIDFNDIIPMLYQEWTKLSTEDREEWRQKAENYIQLRTTM